MKSITWLAPDDPPDVLPDPEQALAEPNGLLAAGGSLRPDWLLHAYSRGIFPWYQTGQPILWWSPDPRAVLTPREVRISRSLAKTLRRGHIEATCDTAFAAVVAGCAAPRRYTDQTWITPEMASAYENLHRLGHAHSFEVWHEGDLVGGLYGVAIGRLFCGESMFTRMRDASKLAFARCLEHLGRNGFELVDCQLPTPHLESLGARPIARSHFLAMIDRLTAVPRDPGLWTESFAATARDP